MILGGVHSIVIGWHNRGKFEKIDEYSESDMEKKSPRVPGLLSKLEQLLKVIKEIAIHTEESEGLEIQFELQNSSYITIVKKDSSMSVEILPVVFSLD